VPERKLGFFAKIKENENFNRRNTGSIRGLKFESDADIGGKDSFCSGNIQTSKVGGLNCTVLTQ
jgi:hypothetical protein